MKEAINYSRIKIINKVNLLKDEIDNLKPISKEREERIFQKFRLDWNYHSCAIEGNTLYHGETVAFLMYGLTAKGKPMKDYNDIDGHNQSIDFLMDLIKNNEILTEKDIRALHKMILVKPYEIEAIKSDGSPTKKMINLGSYKTTPNHVKTPTGQIHYYIVPEETPIKMHELMEWYRECKVVSEIHPVVLASIFHYKFVSIHPFDDGNGRLARIFMNLILMQNNYPPVVIKQQDRNLYYSVLSQADGENMLPFIEFISENLIHSLEIYLKGAKGESIDELDDFDKELALFKKEVKGINDELELRRTLETQQKLYYESIKHFITNLEITLDKINDMFLIYKKFIVEKDPVPIWKYSDVDSYLYSKIFSHIESDNLTESNFFEDYLRNKFDHSDEFPILILAFSYDEFKSENKMFGMEIKIYLELEQYRYKISYSVSEYKELEGKYSNEYEINDREILVSNYYHQQLSREEIKTFCNAIGKNTLSYIKEHFKDPKSHLINIEVQILSKIWFEYLTQIDNPSIKEIFTAGNLTFNFEDQTFMLNISEDDIKYRNEEQQYGTKFVTYIRKELKIKRNLGFRIDIKETKKSRITGL